MYLLGISDKPHCGLLSLKSLGLLRFVSHHTRSYPPPLVGSSMRFWISCMNLYDGFV